MPVDVLVPGSGSHPGQLPVIGSAAGHVLNPVLSFQGSTLQLQQPYLHNLYNNPQAGRSFFADVWLDKNAPGRK